MPSGFELFGLIGSIESTIRIVNHVADAIAALHDYEKDMYDLRLKFQNDSHTLESLQKALSRVREVGSVVEVKDEDQKLFEDIKAHLDVLQTTFKAKLYCADVNGRPVWNLRSKVSWAGWRKRDLFKLEASLRDWVTRVELSYSALEAKLRWGVKGRNTSEDQIALLIDLYKRIKAREIERDRLLKTLDEIDLRSEKSNLSRRMLGYYTGDDQKRQQVIIEYTAKSYTKHSSQEAIDSIGRATCDLAKVLYHSHPDRTLILRAIGYFHDVPKKRFGLLYEIPVHEDWPRNQLGKIYSLQDLLRSTPLFSLTERLKLCCDIAKAVLYIHVMGWVHKSVRPENIIILGSQPRSSAANGQSSKLLPPCYLAGFEYARSAEGDSDRTSDAEWMYNIYRHPSRQGLQGNSEYNMAHDIYSVGVLLLEIGFWGHSSLVPFQSQSKHFQKVTPEEVKKFLEVTLNGTSERRSLATFMGDKYAGVVKYCLTIGEEQEIPGYQFVQRVWLELDQIRTAL